MKKIYLPFLTWVLAGCVTTHPMENDKTSKTAPAAIKPVNVSPQPVPQTDTSAPISRQEPKAVATRSFQSPKSSQIAEPKMIKPDAPKTTQASSPPKPVAPTQVTAVRAAAMPVVDQKKTPMNIELKGTHQNTIRKTDTASSSKKNLWILVMGSVALAAGGWYFKQRQDKLRPVDTQKEDELLAEKAWRNL